MNPLMERGRVRLIYRQTRWLMRLRWIAGIVTLAGGVALWRWPDLFDTGAPITVLGAVILFHNALLVLVLRLRPSLAGRFRELLIFGSVQIHVDLVCLTLLAMWTGGLSSPVLPFYFFHMIFAALLQPRARAYGIAIAAIAMVGAALALTGRWPTSAPDALVGIGWALAVLGTVYLADRVARALYLRELARIRQIERIRSLSATMLAQQNAMIQGEKMAAMGQLAAGIAHEITNPLASMDSVLQLMERRGASASQESINALREQIGRILRIVRQLTAYAHPGRGRIETVPVADFIRSTLDMLGLERRKAHVRLEADVAPDVGSALMNPHALQQVMTNLIVNAFDAVSDVPEPTITLRARREGNECVIEICDNGPGIAPEHLPRLFEPFFTTKPVGQGTGLGLSICARLIREQNGRIEVQSKPGQGATFSIHLPASEPAPERTATPEDAPSAR